MANVTFSRLSTNVSFLGLTSTIGGPISEFNDYFRVGDPHHHASNGSYGHAARSVLVNTTTVDSGVISTSGDNANDSGMDVDVLNPLTNWSLTVYSHEHLVVTSVILGLFVLCCIIGNCFVIAAVILERSLHNVANYLILSLAVADLMVAVLVMPLSVVSEISQPNEIFLEFRRAKLAVAYRITLVTPRCF
ncbi:5-hydroxytryptamine receptor [Bulinus truncatus]|nr:5-hydroxytryptamine receptor [Bulinus truncatus]